MIKDGTLECRYIALVSITDNRKDGYLSDFIRIFEKLVTAKSDTLCIPIILDGISGLKVFRSKIAELASPHRTVFIDLTDKAEIQIVSLYQAVETKDDDLIYCEQRELIAGLFKMVQSYHRSLGIASGIILNQL